MNNKILAMIAIWTMGMGCALEKRRQYKPSSHIQSLKEDGNGVYVYYLDERSKQKRLTGIIKTAKSHYLCRTYNMATKRQYQIGFHLKFTGKEYRIIPDKPKAGMDKKNLLPYCIVDINHIANQYKHLARKRFPQVLEIEDEWPEYGYTLIHNFRFWIPFFNYYGHKKKGGDYNYRLVQVGRHFGNSRTDNFFQVKKLPDYKTLEGLVISPREKQSIQMERIQLQLDKNWQKIDPSQYNLPTLLGFFWLSQKTMRDSQLNVEKLSLKQLHVDNIYELMRITIPFNHILPESHKIYHKNHKIIHEFDNVDPDSGYINHSISVFMQGGEGTVYSVNISGFKGVIARNRNYFLSIVDSILLK